MELVTVPVLDLLQVWITLAEVVELLGLWVDLSTLELTRSLAVFIVWNRDISLLPSAGSAFLERMYTNNE